MTVTTDRVEIMRVYRVDLTPDATPNEAGDECVYVDVDDEPIVLSVEVPLRYHPDEADLLHPLCEAARAEAAKRAVKLERRANQTSDGQTFTVAGVKLLRTRIVAARPSRGGRLKQAA